MDVERRLIQTKIVPEMKAYCAKKGWQFEVVDLRWGVSFEAASHHKTMRICINELRHCQQLSPKPNFLILTGQRYGWIPLPESISKDDAECLLEIANITEQNIFHFWYELDKNEIPYTYFIKPEEVYDPVVDNPAYNYFESEKIICDLFNRYWVQTQDIRFFDKYCSSATEQEIIEGVFKHPELKEHILYYERELLDIPMDKEALFIEKDKQNRIDILKNKLKRVIPECQIIKEVMTYDYYQSDRFEEGFVLRFKESLRTIIDAEINNNGDFTDEKEEEIIGKSLLDEVVSYFEGMQYELRQLHSFVDSRLSNEICLVNSLSGSGRTSFLAYFIKEYGPGNLIYRFIGKSCNSSDGLFLLKSILRQCAVPFKDSENYIKLAQKCSQYLYDDQIQRIIILDGLEILHKNDPFLDLSWIPVPIPPHLCVVLSKVTDFEIDALKMFSVKTISLEGLSSEFAEKAICKSLRQKHRQISAGQMQTVIDCYEKLEYDPLFLRVIFQMCVEWRSSTSVTLPNHSFQQLFNFYLDHLCKPENHNKHFVILVLGLLCYSNNGLTEDEILELTACDSAYYNELMRDSYHKLVTCEGFRKRIPYVIWTKFYFDFSQFLIMKRVCNGITVTFSNHRIEEWVNDYLIQCADNREHIYGLLQKYYEEDHSYINTRTLEELPYAYVRNNDVDKIVNLLCDLEFIQSMSAHNMLSELEFYYSETFSLCVQDKRMMERLTFFHEFVRSNKSFLIKFAKLDRNSAKKKYAIFQTEMELINEKCYPRMFVSLMISNTECSSLSEHYALIGSYPENSYFGNTVYSICYIWDLCMNRMYRHINIPLYRYQGNNSYTLSSLTKSVICDDRQIAYIYDDSGVVWIWNFETNTLQSEQIGQIQDFCIGNDHSLFYITDSCFCKYGFDEIINIKSLSSALHFTKLYVNNLSRSVLAFSDYSEYVEFNEDTQSYIIRNVTPDSTELMILFYSAFDNYIYYRPYEEPAMICCKNVEADENVVLLTKDYVFKMYANQDHQYLVYVGGDKLRCVDIASQTEMYSIQSMYTDQILKIGTNSHPDTFYTVNCNNFVVWKVYCANRG